MKKKDVKGMTFEDFKDALSSDMFSKLAKMNIPYLRAYKILQETLLESTLNDEDDMGTMESIVMNIILDYKEEM